MEFSKLPEDLQARLLAEHSELRQVFAEQEAEERRKKAAKNPPTKNPPKIDHERQRRGQNPQRQPAKNNDALFAFTVFSSLAVLIIQTIVLICLMK